MDDKVIGLLFDLQRQVERLSKRVALLERRVVVSDKDFFLPVVDKPVDGVVDN